MTNENTINKGYRRIGTALIKGSERVIYQHPHYPSILVFDHLDAGRQYKYLLVDSVNKLNQSDNEHTE